MEKVGVILAGGGAKGAYEMGAWKALQDIFHELGLSVDAFSGTSVGALNAALFSCVNVSEAENVWDKVDMKTILTPDISKILGSVPYSSLISIITKLSLNIAISMVDLIPILSILEGLSFTGGISLFTRDGLTKIIEDTSIKNTIDSQYVWACCYNTGKNKGIEYHRLNNINYLDYLLASSSLPIVFGRKNVDRNGIVKNLFLNMKSMKSRDSYLDGGLPWIGDNVPITPLTPNYKFEDFSCKKYIVVHLSKNDKSSFDNVDLSGCQVYHLFPDTPLRGFWDTLNFTPERISQMKSQAIDEVSNEFYDISRIRELLLGSSEKECHLYRGKLFSNIGEMYSDISSKKYVESNEEFIDALKEKQSNIHIRNPKLESLLVKISKLSPSQISLLLSTLSSVGVATAGGILAGSITVVSVPVLVPIIGIAGGIGGVLTILSLYKISNGFDFMSLIKKYSVERDNDGELILFDKSVLENKYEYDFQALKDFYNI